MATYRLTNETIDMLSDQIAQVYSSLGNDSKETYRARLILEEALLKYQTRFGEDVNISFRVYRVFSQTRFCVRIEALSFDPFTNEENPMAFMLRSMLADFGNTAPSWKYRNLTNELVFSVRRKVKTRSVSGIAIAVVSALVLGVLARLYLPKETLNVIVSDYLDPLSDAYAGLFCVMAVLLTMFGITLSIVRLGDVASVGALGGRILRRYYVLATVATVVLVAPILPLFSIEGIGKLSGVAKSVYDILIDFIPTNLVTPFVQFNTVHIVIIGAMFGLSLLTMGQRGETLVRLFDECNLVAILTNGFLNRFIAVYAGFKLFDLITLSEFSLLLRTGKMVLCILAAQFVLFVFYAIYPCVKTKTPLRKYLRGMMPTFLICLTSANFGAAFTTCIDSVMEMGADDTTTNISLNLGSVFCQPASTVMFVISSLFLAAQFDVKITVVWLILCVLLSIIMTAAMPNIPGAAVTVYTLLFSQLGLPSQALSVAIAVSAIMQFPSVAVDVWCLQGECMCVCESVKKVAD